MDETGVVYEIEDPKYKTITKGAHNTLRWDNTSGVKRGFRPTLIHELVKCDSCPAYHFCPEAKPGARGCPMRFEYYASIISALRSSDDRKYVSMIEEMLAQLSEAMFLKKLQLNDEGKIVDKQYLDMFREIRDTLVSLSKIVHGEKKVIHKEVTYKDLSNMMFKVIDAEVVDGSERVELRGDEKASEADGREDKPLGG
jgi:hypothetical protein